jgi:hypothetical protein
MLNFNENIDKKIVKEFSEYVADYIVQQIKLFILSGTSLTD